MIPALRKDKSRFILLLGIILLIVFISVFVNLFLGRDIVYTHLFYLPIILAGIWYYKRALYVAVFLGLFHIGLNFFQEGMFAYSAVIRALIFCLITYVIGTLAEKKDTVFSALEQAQKEKSLILENLSELVVLYDHQQRIVWANPAAGKSFPANYEELAGKKCYEIWHQRQVPCEECPVTKTLETGSVHRSEITTPDNRCWNITGSPVIDEHGSIVGAVETALDITESKRTKEALEQLNIQLEQRVQERTSKLELLNQELDAFSYSVSHDLQAPLRSIRGFSKALLDHHGDKLDKQGKDYLHRVFLAGQRMSELIDDLLSLSRVTRLEMLREKVNLSFLVSSSLTALQEQEPEREIQFSVEPDIFVWGDAALLRIAIDNLLGNAWKFTEKTRNARIEFSASQQGGRIVYSIRDNGVGFNSAHADKVFGAFQRLHDSKEYSGTGIGLSIVARIIKRHEGKIWAEGEVGNGAEFSFILGEQEAWPCRGN